MKQNNQKEPMQETTKDDSSDVNKVKQDQGRTDQNAEPSDETKEREEAEKGHS